MTPMARRNRVRQHPRTGHRDRHGVAEARKTLDTAYRWLEDAVTERRVGDRPQL